MTRFKYIDTSPRFIAIDLQRQLLPGTFEHAVNHLLDHVIDLTRFNARFRNDVTGAPDYPPALLLTVGLVAYAHGIVVRQRLLALPSPPCAVFPPELRVVGTRSAYAARA